MRAANFLIAVTLFAAIGILLERKSALPLPASDGSIVGADGNLLPHVHQPKLVGDSGHIRLRYGHGALSAHETRNVGGHSTALAPSAP